MEEDTVETNVGSFINDELAILGGCKPKQPTKRFVGRRIAEKAEKANGGLNGMIENSGAIQGMQESAVEVLC